MEDENNEKIKYEFLIDRKATAIFSKVDYFLKSGMHIQRDYPLPGEIFRFIDRHYKSLKSYYMDFFNVILCYGGDDFQKYYYIDFEIGNRGNIPTDYREYLKTEYIIIGMLYLKMYKLDGNLELDKVSDFTKLLFTEYEEEKNGFRKLISDNSSEKSSDFTDQKIEDIIKRAFGKFNDLGWINWIDENNKDNFVYNISFERLRLFYQPQILKIDSLITDLNNG